MLTTHYTQVGAMYTISHEVVNRVALERDEGGQTAFHVAKRDYQLTMNRISPRVPATRYDVTMGVKNDFNASAESMSSSGKFVDNGLDCSEIEKELAARAARRFEEGTDGGSSWKRRGQPKKPLELLTHRESLVRQDIEDVEHEMFHRLTESFFADPLMYFIKLTREERRERKMLEDDWMSESIPFLDHCRMKQVDFAEAFLHRALGKVKRPPLAVRASSPPLTSAVLDIRLYQPLLHRCETIRWETETEEEMAFLFLRLGEASQRDLVAGSVMRQNKKTGLLDTVRHPVAVNDYDKVAFAFESEFRCLESREETERMALIDAWLSESFRLCKAVGTLALMDMEVQTQ